MSDWADAFRVVLHHIALAHLRVGLSCLRREMKTFAKCLITAALFATTAGFTHATVFDVNDPARGLHRMHAELVVGP